jgi:hypothetical protein
MQIEREREREERGVQGAHAYLELDRVVRRVRLAGRARGAPRAVRPRARRWRAGNAHASAGGARETKSARAREEMEMGEWEKEGRMGRRTHVKPSDVGAR